MNLVSWLDRLLMPHHLYLEYPGPGITDPHNLRDPEGLLSDLPAVGTALLGVLTGLWLRGQRAVKSTALDWRSGGDLPGAGIFVVARVSAQQESVDELVCAGRGRVVA
jgi:predicted acyltransferase